MRPRFRPFARPYHRTRLLLEPLESRELLTATPLPDLGPGLYKGVEGGLYPGGSDTRPPDFEAAGIDIAQNQIQPLDASGNPDPANGRIVMISVGMSNTTQEFGGSPYSFKPRADADPGKNPQLVIVDGAQGGMAADSWVDPNAPTWNTVDQRLRAARVTPAQVEVAWVKEADIQPARFGDFPAPSVHLAGELAAIARNLVTRYPNIKIAYYSSRTHAYTDDPRTLNPEPFAYESAFSVKALIQRQIEGRPGLNYDPNLGPVVAPYLSWGPYLWADGTNPRSDGFTWDPQDVQGDFTHPSPSGVYKVASQLLAFFKTDPTATPWFLNPQVIGDPPAVDAAADTPSGTAPLTVHFSADAQSNDSSIVEYAWTFDDGTFSFDQNPVKTFPAPGDYNVHLTVTDDLGNTVTQTVPVSVAAAEPEVVKARKSPAATRAGWQQVVNGLNGDHGREIGPPAVDNLLSARTDDSDRVPWQDFTLLDEVYAASRQPTKVEETTKAAAVRPNLPRETAGLLAPSGIPVGGVALL